MGYAPVKMKGHFRPESTGNAALLAVVDSRGSYSDTSIVDETVLVALRHLGFPYRTHDLAAGPLTPALLAGCSAVILAQARVGPALSASEAELIAAAVRDGGLGLVSFDGGSLASHPGPLLGLLELQVEPLPAASDLLRVGRTDHYVTATQPGSSVVRLKRPVTFSQVKRAGHGAVELAQYSLGKDQLIFSRHNIPGTAYEPGQYPAVLAGQTGRGRVVQFTCSPRLWHRDFYGHGMGLDAFFWRAITWAARKPFIAQMMPPFVTIRVDDAIGRHDLAYTDVMNRHGHRPLISCFVEEVSPALYPYMRERSAAAQVDWDAHALDYYTLIPFNFGVGEYDEARLAQIFARVDRWYAEGGFRAPRTAYFHWGEIGLRALPHLKSRGRTFVYAPYHIGQLKWERIFPNWYPYGLNSLFYDHHPEDPDFYNVGAGLPRHLIEPDVLTGCTTWAGENPVNDMVKAAGRAAGSVQMALDSGFFCEITTHEQKFAVLSLEEMDRWLALLAKEVARYDVSAVGHEEAILYTQARDTSWLASVQTTDGRAAVDLDGETGTVPMQFAVFTDEGPGVGREWVNCGTIAGPTRVAL